MKAGSHSPADWARKTILEFMSDNKIDAARLNHGQKIVLVGAGFDADTRSAAAWLAVNGIPLRMIEVQPNRISGMYFLNIVQLIPVPTYEDFYVSLTAGSGGATAKPKTGSTGIVRH